MPITALPQTTIRAIGSTSVISDPCSVVKELVDNALDALASSLLIEISQNTVDVIQLKDNGHGISSEDHLYVCRRTFTSKIQTIDDLRNVGGTSLGFRGEALASVAEMSGGVIITSRVEPETSASCLKYGRNGELSGYLASRSSLPTVQADICHSKDTAGVTSCGDHCPYYGLSQARPCPQTNCVERCCEEFDQDEKASAGVRYGSTFEEVFLEDPQG